MANEEFSEKQNVAQLILDVLTDKVVVREAIKRFPRESQDYSVISAYHALVHREADEDLRRRDLLYRDEQDEYLEFLAQTLSKNLDLPKNVIKNYNKYYKETYPSKMPNMKGLLQKLCKFLNV